MAWTLDSPCTHSTTISIHAPWLMLCSLFTASFYSSFVFHSSCSSRFCQRYLILLIYSLHYNRLIYLRPFGPKQNEQPLATRRQHGRRARMPPTFDHTLTECRSNYFNLKLVLLLLNGWLNHLARMVCLFGFGCGACRIIMIRAITRSTVQTIITLRHSIHWPTRNQLACPNWTFHTACLPARP